MGPAAPCSKIFHVPHYLLNKVPILELGIQGSSKTLAVSGPLLPLFFPFPNQQMYMESVLGARCCSRDWECDERSSAASRDL